VLGVLLTPNLSLDKHVTLLSAKCFFQLRQLRSNRRSLDDHSIVTLVHAFVTSRVDYCVGLLAVTCAPKKTTTAATRPLLSSRIKPQQVRPRSDPVPAPDFTLAQRQWPNAVQAMSPSVQLSAQHGSRISGRAL